MQALSLRFQMATIQKQDGVPIESIIQPTINVNHVHLDFGVVGQGVYAAWEKNVR